MKKILDVKEKKGVITEYLVEEYGWVDKTHAIDFALKGIIDAVIVNEKSGTFLRAKPDNTTRNNLKKK